MNQTLTAPTNRTDVIKNKLTVILEEHSQLQSLSPKLWQTDALGWVTNVFMFLLCYRKCTKRFENESDDNMFKAQ